MNGGRPVRVLLALLIGWTVLREAEVGPLRPLMHGPLFGKLAYWIVIVGASLLTLWRAHSRARARGAGVGPHRHRLAAVGLRRRLLDARPRRQRRHPRAVGLRRRLPGLLPARVRGPVPAAALAGRGGAEDAVGRRADRRARRRRHERRGRPAGRPAHGRRQRARRRHQPRLPDRRPHPPGRRGRRLRAARLARRSHLGAAGPGHRALLDRRLLLPRHRRQRDLRLSEPVGWRLDLVPRALLGRRLAARDAARWPSRTAGRCASPPSRSPSPASAWASSSSPPWAR